MTCLEDLRGVGAFMRFLRCAHVNTLFLALEQDDPQLSMPLFVLGSVSLTFSPNLRGKAQSEALRRTTRLPRRSSPPVIPPRPSTL